MLPVNVTLFFIFTVNIINFLYDSFNYVFLENYANKIEVVVTKGQTV